MDEFTDVTDNGESVTIHTTIDETSQASNSILSTSEIVAGSYVYKCSVSTRDSSFVSMNSTVNVKGKKALIFN